MKKILLLGIFLLAPVIVHAEGNSGNINHKVKFSDDGIYAPTPDYLTQQGETGVHYKDGNKLSTCEISGCDGFSLSRSGWELVIHEDSYEMRKKV